MSDRIEEIRSRLTAALQAAKAQRDRQSQGFIIPCMEHTEAIRKWEAHVPADLEFLLAEVERLNDACRQYEQAMLAAREKLTELRQQMADSEEG